MLPTQWETPKPLKGNVEVSLPWFSLSSNKMYNIADNSPWDTYVHVMQQFICVLQLKFEIKGSPSQLTDE